MAEGSVARGQQAEAGRSGGLLDSSSLFRQSVGVAEHAARGTETDDWERLGHHVRAAYRGLGLTLKAFAEAAGVSTRTAGKLVNGRRVGDDTLADAARVLQWAPDRPWDILRHRDEARDDPSDPASPAFIPAPGFETAVMTMTSMSLEDRAQVIRAKRLADASG